MEPLRRSGHFGIGGADIPPVDEALLEQAVPQTAAVKNTAGASFSVEYGGTPKFEPIDGTAMTYAVNTSAAVISFGPRTSGRTSSVMAAGHTS